MTLIADGPGAHVPKGYVYAAMGSAIEPEHAGAAAARAGHGPGAACGFPFRSPPCGAGGGGL